MEGASVSLKNILASASLLLAVVSPGSNAAPTDLPVVDLGYRLQRASGYNDTGRYYNFSNIRYAAPPIGKLRFAPPHAPEQDRSVVHDGLNEGRVCPQATVLPWYNVAFEFLMDYFLGMPFNGTEPPKLEASDIKIPPPDPRTSEDCLFLDVVVPKGIFDCAKDGKRAPVLVWIYGGGYTTGSKTDNFDPIGLFKRGEENVIFVALNYRLGAMGWSSGPTFQEHGASNAGLRDQRFALEWVQKNIHNFGGDPKKVTVMGESAGGGSIIHQITAYGGHKEKSPFQQAIAQSPGWFPQPSKPTQEGRWTRFLKSLNVSTIEEARNLPSENIIRANTVQVAIEANYGEFLYGPTVDGDFVPDLPGALLLHGEFDKSLKVMAGHNGNEGILFSSPYVRTDDDFKNLIRSKLPQATNEVVDYIVNVLYPPVFDGSKGYKSNVEREALLVSELAFTCNTNYLAHAYGNKTYGYIFNIPPSIHGQDIRYSFYTGDNQTKPVTGGGLADSVFAVQNATVAVAMQEFFTSFVQEGKPNGGGVIPRFDVYGPNAEVVELNATSIGDVMDPAANERCVWWQKALYY